MEFSVRLLKEGNLSPHFTDEYSEAQTGWVRWHRAAAEELRFEAKQADPQILKLMTEKQTWVVPKSFLAIYIIYYLLYDT